MLPLANGRGGRKKKGGAYLRTPPLPSPVLTGIHQANAPCQGFLLPPRLAGAYWSTLQSRLPSTIPRSSSPSVPSKVSPVTQQTTPLSRSRREARHRPPSTVSVRVDVVRTPPSIQSSERCSASAGYFSAIPEVSALPLVRLPFSSSWYRRTNFATWTLQSGISCPHAGADREQPQSRNTAPLHLCHTEKRK